MPSCLHSFMLSCPSCPIVAQRGGDRLFWLFWLFWFSSLFFTFLHFSFFFSYLARVWKRILVSFLMSFLSHFLLLFFFLCSPVLIMDSLEDFDLSAEPMEFEDFTLDLQFPGLNVSSSFDRDQDDSLDEFLNQSLAPFPSTSSTSPIPVIANPVLTPSTGLTPTFIMETGVQRKRVAQTEQNSQGKKSKMTTVWMEEKRNVKNCQLSISSFLSFRASWINCSWKGIPSSRKIKNWREKFKTLKERQHFWRTSSTTKKKLTNTSKKMSTLINSISNCTKRTRADRKWFLNFQSPLSWRKCLRKRRKKRVPRTLELSSTC